MPDDDSKKVTPKLRFPEFRDDGGWQPHSFMDVARRVKRAIPTATVALDDYVSTENLLPDFGGLSHSTKLPPVTTVTQYKPKDTLLANIRPYLKKAWYATRTGGASNDVFVFRSRGNVVPRFLNHRIQSDDFISFVMSGAKGLKMPRGDLAHIEQFSFPLPPTDAEQQKIADCLSSLDALITAQGRKLEALRVYKKGLMQQLFPREGETVPRLRFSEFWDGGEWEEHKLGKHVEISNGGSPSQFALSAAGRYPFVKVEDLNNCTKYQIAAREFCDDAEGAVPRHSLVFPKRGAAIELNKIRITGTEILIDTNVMAITPGVGLSSEFLFYYISNVGLAHIADTSTIPQINNKHIIPFGFLSPSPAEQQRIADCLSSLDAMIAALAEKLAALQAHKKGLMQQLFPSSEDTAT